MSQTSDVLDYELIGDDLQAVIVTLDPGETVIAEAGAMMFMEQGIEMNTTLDPNQFATAGIGWDRPADASDPNNHARNRRVEIKVYPLEQK